MKKREEQPWSDRVTQYVADRYVHFLKKTLATKKSRTITYLLPVILLILSFVFLSPHIGFKLFPSGDNPFILIDIINKQGTTSDAMKPYAEHIDKVFAQLPEIKAYQINILPSTLDITVILKKKEERQRNSFEVQDEIISKLSYLQQQ